MSDDIHLPIFAEMQIPKKEIKQLGGTKGKFAWRFRRQLNKGNFWLKIRRTFLKVRFQGWKMSI